MHLHTYIMIDSYNPPKLSAEIVPVEAANEVSSIIHPT